MYSALRPKSHTIHSFATLSNFGTTCPLPSKLDPPMLIWFKSINAPIAAFTMAIILCSYCFSSIRTARRDAQIPAPTSGSYKRAYSSERKDEAWVQQALDESRAQNDGKGQAWLTQRDQLVHSWTKCYTNWVFDVYIERLLCQLMSLIFHLFIGFFVTNCN